MTHQVQFTRRAVRDLDGIWDYLVRHESIDRAEHVVAEIEVNVRKLAAMPGMGHAHRDIRQPGYRVWSVFSYLIVYRTHGQTLIVTRVIHGRRDLRALFR